MKRRVAVVIDDEEEDVQYSYAPHHRVNPRGLPDEPPGQTAKQKQRQRQRQRQRHQVHKLYKGDAEVSGKGVIDLVTPPKREKKILEEKKKNKQQQTTAEDVRIARRLQEEADASFARSLQQPAPSLPPQRNDSSLARALHKMYQQEEQHRRERERQEQEQHQRRQYAPYYDHHPLSIPPVHRFHWARRGGGGGGGRGEDLSFLGDPNRYEETLAWEARQGAVKGPKCFEQHQIDLLPISDATDANRANTCAICLEALSSRLRWLPCMHHFHTACIDPWLKTSIKCPTCLAEIKLS